MFASVHSVALVGVEPRPVRVEVHVGGGQHAVLSLVGLPDAAVREAKERVRAALASSGYRFPGRRVTVNLAPADIPKAGSAYDLPIALGVLAAGGLIPPAATRAVALGELALDGSVRAARGGLGAGLVARSMKLPCLLPVGSAVEAARVPGADIRAVNTLPEAVAVALGEAPGADFGGGPVEAASAGVDLAEVRGQLAARRALEVAAAGGHHLIMSGPPGVGKTMLARALPGILPRLSEAAALEVGQAWAAAGLDRGGSTVPPFRSPHHTASVAAIVGGGHGIPTPGELTLAHRGVLFLDELGEFPAALLNSLRQPIEDGSVTIARRGISIRFPCRAQVVAATNPCPCGHAGDRLASCRCSARAMERYLTRLSGPLLDRFDLSVALTRSDPAELASGKGESSQVVGERVADARRRQIVRGIVNRDLTRDALDDLAWRSGALRLIESAVTRLALTGRGWDRVRRVARTVADLAGEEEVAEAHVAEALAYRGLQ